MIEVSLRDGIAVVELAHGKANAMDVEFCQALTRQLEDLESATAKAVVLTAKGRIFSAGVNLIRLSAGGSDYVHIFLPALNRLFETVFQFPKPVVAAINGHAVAGGCVLACCADRRLMARDGGRIGVTELQVGVPFPPLAFEVMRAVTTSRYFAEVIYGGATYPADDAVQRGLVDEIVPADALMDRAMAAAHTLATLSPPAFAETKRQMQAPVTMWMQNSAAIVDAAITEIWAVPEAAARIKDYVGRTLKKP